MSLLTPFRTRFATGVALAALACFWPAAWRFAVPALSPYVAVGAALTVRSASLAWLCGLPMLWWVSRRRRFWCRWMCPVGLISESSGKWRRAQRKPVPPSRRVPLARTLALTTLGGALLGYPLFLWLDPLALFGGFFSIARITHPNFTPWAVAGLPLLTLFSLLWPGQWCARLCPLGGLQDLLAVAAKSLRQKRLKPSRGRRAVLTAGSGAVAAALLPRLWAKERHPLRPPGAVDETAFQGGCIRCGSCARACPAQIIEPALEANHPAGLLAPQLRFRGTQFCRQDCNVCGRVCPTGVIRPLALTEKNRCVIGIAAIDKTDCYLTLEKECGICVPRCPRAALVDVFLQVTYQTEIQVLRDRCNGCGACVGICPPRVIRIEAIR